MVSDNNNQEIEISKEGNQIEIYTAERINEFLAEDELTPEEEKRLEERLKESKILKSSPHSERS